MLKIQVTEDDIKNGVRNECDNCPVARAIARAADYQYIVDVIGPEVYFWTTDPENRPSAMLPEHVTQRIMMYDTSGFMEPVEFDLEIS